MFKEIVKKQRHSVQYEDYDFESGLSHQAIADNLAAERSQLANFGNTSQYKVDTKSTISGKGSTMKLAFGNLNRNKYVNQ